MTSTYLFLRNRKPIENLFEGYINIQKVSLKLDDNDKFSDYLNFSSFAGEANIGWIFRRIWPIRKK